MTTPKDILETWAHNWRSLRAWGRPLEEIQVKIVGRRNHQQPGCGGIYSSGVAFPRRRFCVIRAGANMPDALATILHEYAHLAAPANVQHGEGWSKRFAKAIQEVSGVPITYDGRRQDIDDSATLAMEYWRHKSGNYFAAKLLGV